MNDLVFVFFKQEQVVKFPSDCELDMTLYGGIDEVFIPIDHLYEEQVFQKNTLLCGFESKNGALKQGEQDSLFLTGDPYHQDISSTESFIEVVSKNEAPIVYEKLSGAYTWLNVNHQNANVNIHTDLFGQVPIFYVENEVYFAMATSIQLLISILPTVPRTVNMERMIEFMVTGKINDQNDSFFKHIHRLAGNKRLTYNFSSLTLEIENITSFDYFRDPNQQLTPVDLREDLKTVIKSATYQKKSAYTLSGGVDSTLVAAIGATIEKTPLACYTASTGYGNDLKFSRQAAQYIGAKLDEVPLDYEPSKLEFIFQATKAHGMPIPIRGSSIAFPLMCKSIKGDHMDVVLNGTCEFFFSGAAYSSFIGPSYFRHCAKHCSITKLVKLIKIYIKNGIMPKKTIFKELFLSWFIYEDRDQNSQVKLSGKDTQGFFKPDIQKIRNSIKVEKNIYMDYKNDLLHEFVSGEAQRLMYQGYQAGIISHIKSRTPFLDTRLIKYMDIDEETRFFATCQKQFARESMHGLMDNDVIYRKDNEGLRWRSTVLLKENKVAMIDEIRKSKFLQTTLSEKTLRQLENKTFRKSLLLSLYSVALLDRAFDLSLD